MRSGEVAQVLSELARRVEALEAAATRSDPPTARPLDLVNRLLAETPGPDLADQSGQGTVTYAGAGRTDDGTIAYQMSRSWVELLTADPSSLASCLVALASPVRVAIVQTLARGPATKADLSAALDEPSSGQLYHHIKELTAAGIIHQPDRAVYAMQPHRVVPLLALLAAALDLSQPAAGAPVTIEERP